MMKSHKNLMKNLSYKHHNVNREVLISKRDDIDFSHHWCVFIIKKFISTNSSTNFFFISFHHSCFFFADSLLKHDSPIKSGFYLFGRWRKKAEKKTFPIITFMLFHLPKKAAHGRKLRKFAKRRDLQKKKNKDFALIMMFPCSIGSFLSY